MQLPEKFLLALFVGITGTLLIVVGFWLRLWQIQNIPLYYYHDEMDHVFIGEAVARYGSDLSGHWHPWELRPMQTINITGELPAVWHALAQKFFGYGPQSGHIPNTIFGIALAFSAGIVSWLAWKSKVIAFFATGIILSNPLFVHLSRTAYEGIPALFFETGVVLTTLLLPVSLRASGSLNLPKHSKHSIFYKVLGLLLPTFVVFLFLISAFFAFFTYHGAKFTILAMLPISLVYWYIQVKNVKLKTLFIFLTVFFMIGLISYAIHSSRVGYYGGRGNDLVWSSSEITNSVNLYRRQSLEYPFQQVFENRYAEISRRMIQGLGVVADWQRLVLYGNETGFQFSLFVHGFFYLSSVLFVILGISECWMFVKKKDQPTLFLTGILFISPVATIITSGGQSILRSSLTYWLILIVAAVGLNRCIRFIHQRKWPSCIILYAFLLIVVVGELSFFSYRYFARYAIATADNHYFFEELLAAYLSRYSGKAMIVTSDPYSRSRSIISSLGLMPKLSQEEREQFEDARRETIVVGELIFTSNCPDFGEIEFPILLESTVFESCGTKTWMSKHIYSTLNPPQPVSINGPLVAIGSPIDSRAYYYILNDSVCNEIPAADYTYTRDIRNYDPLHLSREKYCRTWVKKEL